MKKPNEKAVEKVMSLDRETQLDVMHAVLLSLTNAELVVEIANVIADNEFPSAAMLKSIQLELVTDKEFSE